ncbi:MAG: hypothetical protein OHK0039_11920 [Bacteroidia bacterium]
MTTTPYKQKYNDKMHMAPIRKEAGNYILTIDQSLVSEDDLTRLLEFLEFRALASQSKLTAAQAHELSQQVKSAGWQQVKNTFISGV